MSSFASGFDLDRSVLGVSAAIPRRGYKAPGWVAALGYRRTGVPKPGHELPLRGNTRNSSGSALRADLATRGFAISSLTSLSVARADSFLMIFFAMIDDSTLPVKRTVNPIQVG